MSARTDAATALQTELGGKFDVRDDEDLPDKPTKSVVMIRLLDYTPADNAIGTMRANLRFTLVSKLEDQAKADDELEGTIKIDGTLPAVLKAIHKIGMTWTKSTRGLVKDTYVGHAIDAWIPTNTPY